MALLWVSSLFSLLYDLPLHQSCSFTSLIFLCHLYCFLVGNFVKNVMQILHREFKVLLELILTLVPHDPWYLALPQEAALPSKGETSDRGRVHSTGKPWDTQSPGGAEELLPLPTVWCMEDRLKAALPSEVSHRLRCTGSPLPTVAFYPPNIMDWCAWSSSVTLWKGAHRFLFYYISFF